MTLQRVQHHHAHVAVGARRERVRGRGACWASRFDGTGHGDDGAVWGGEVLLADYDGYERLAHLVYVPLAGGDAAVRRPYRMALAHLHAAGVPWDEDLPCVAVAPERERSRARAPAATGLACVPTSSMGRLVDAVASLAGVCHEAGYEGQAAMELQALAERRARRAGGRRAGRVPAAAAPPPAVRAAASGTCAALVRAVADDVRAGVPAEVVARPVPPRGGGRGGAGGAARPGPARGVDGRPERRRLHRRGAAVADVAGAARGGVRGAAAPPGAGQRRGPGAGPGVVGAAPAVQLGS